MKLDIRHFHYTRTAISLLKSRQLTDVKRVRRAPS